MTTFLAIIKFIGWRGALALLFALLALNAVRERDAQELRAVTAEGAAATAAALVAAKNTALLSAADALGRCAVDIRNAGSANNDWRNVTGQVNNLLGECQAENRRVSEDARNARRRAEQIEAQAERDMGNSVKRFQNATPPCVSALKTMGAACAGQL